MSGLFITFEGTEGAGKSTLIKEIERWLREKEIDFVGQICWQTVHAQHSFLSNDLKNIICYLKNDLNRLSLLLALVV